MAILEKYLSCHAVCIFHCPHFIVHFHCPHFVFLILFFINACPYFVQRLAFVVANVLIIVDLSNTNSETLVTSEE